MAFTTTGVVTNLVQTAYDRLVQMALRNQPVHRALVDVRPRQVPMPGSAVVMQLYGDLAPATTPLTEDVDPTEVAISNTSTITISGNEYGNAAVVTRKLNLFSLSDVDPAVADQIAFNMIQSIDRLVREVARLGTNVSFSGDATTTVTVDPTDTITSPDIREIVALMRGRKALPKKGELFASYIHPYVSMDLRAEIGNNAAWREPHVYSAPDAIWAGEIGQYEGAFFVETNRAFSANDGEPTGGATGVFRTLFCGKQALAEAVWDEFHVVVGPVTDKLKRFRPIGWTGTAGWSRYREACLHRLESAATLTARNAVPSDL